MRSISTPPVKGKRELFEWCTRTNCIFVRFRIFFLSRDVMRGTVFFQLFVGVTFITITVFNLELVSAIMAYTNSIRMICEDYLDSQATKKMDQNIFVLINCLISGLVFVFAYCYAGSMTTEQFLRYADVSYGTLWYLLPPDLQRYFAFIIADAQRPLIFDGLRIIDLNLSAFTNILKTVVSYFMMLKRLAA